MTFLVLVVVVAILWRFASPGEQFLRGFARLLGGAAIQRGALSFFSGRSFLTGSFQGRDVAIRQQLKRSRYGQGYLVVAMRTAVPSTLDSSAIDSRVRDERGRRALSSIASQDLILELETGWLKALWRPQGFVIFPGRFSPERWSQVLDALHAVASSLDAAA